MRRRALTLLTVLAVVFVAAPSAFAQPLPWSRYKRGDVHRGKQRLRVTDRAAANSNVSLIASFLTSIAPSDECTGNSLSLSDGTAVTSTRSSSGTCFKSDATLVTLTSDKPRVQSAGLLRESAGTNLFFRSEACDTAGAWGNQGLCQADQGVAPDGNSTADRLHFDTPQNASNYQIKDLSAFGSVAISAFWKTKPAGTDTVVAVGAAWGSSTVTCTCYTSDGRACSVAGGAGFCGGYMTTNGTWARLVVIASTAFGASSTGFIRIGIPGATVTGDALVWGAQLEGGGRASSYIATAGTSVTRNADSLSFTTPAGVVDAEGCVKATVHVRSPTTPATWIGMTGFAYQDSTTVAKFNDGTNTTSVTAGTSTDGRNVVMTAGWKSLGSSTLISSDGVSATGTYDGAWTAGTTYLGGKSDGSGALNGYVQALYLYNSKTACQ